MIKKLYLVLVFYPPPEALGGADFIYVVCDGPFLGDGK